MPDINEVIVHLQRFSWSDYVLFVLMLLICIVIGIYFGFFEKKGKRSADDAEDDYLVGGRKMPVFPVALSLVAR